jgi:hypothetical protein
MSAETLDWLICPLFFIGMMILCMIFSRRKGRRFCCFPSDNRSDNRERIRKLEDEIERLKDK